MSENRSLPLAYFILNYQYGCGSVPIQTGQLDRFILLASFLLATSEFIEGIISRLRHGYG